MREVARLFAAAGRPRIVGVPAGEVSFCLASIVMEVAAGVALTRPIMRESLIGEIPTSVLDAGLGCVPGDLRLGTAVVRQRDVWRIDGRDEVIAETDTSVSRRAPQPIAIDDGDPVGGSPA